jgi:hypothetical protein
MGTVLRSIICLLEADQLLLALRCGANNDQQALRIVFQPGLNMNAGRLILIRLVIWR